MNLVGKKRLPEIGETFGELTFAAQGPTIDSK